MEGYRVYILGSDGKIVRREEYFSSDDNEAIERARIFVKDCLVEVWTDGNVRIAVLRPD